MIRSARTLVTTALRQLGSLLPPSRSRQPIGSQLIHSWREDALRSYPTVGLTPSRMLSLLQSADAGMPQSMFELFAEMLQKWPRLTAVESTRRLALTGLDWELTPAAAPTPVRPGPSPSPSSFPSPSSSQPTVTADAVVEWCAMRLDQLPALRTTLDHLANAIGQGISVAELVWERGELIDLVPVPMSRLVSDRLEPCRLRVRTQEHPTDGIALDEQANKWIIHEPRATPGRPFQGGLLRASALLYIAQNLSFKDWLVYSQIAGMPIRVAQFDSGVTDQDKAQLLKMLGSLGTEAAAVFSKNIDLKLLDAASGPRPYEAIQNYCNTEITILWLGQHLTTDIRQSGSRAAAEIHDRVREDLLVDDIHDEAETIRRDLLTPMVHARFGPQAPVPHFRRSLVQSVDTKVLADTLAVAVNRIGMRVPSRWAHRSLGIPEPTNDEAVLQAGTVR